MLTIRIAKRGILEVLFVVGFLSLPCLGRETKRRGVTGARPLSYCSCPESIYFECTRKQSARFFRWA